MDARPRRSISSQVKMYNEDEIDRAFEASMREDRAHRSHDRNRTRSGEAPDILRKRKRDSDSPRLPRHVPLRGGLRTSLSSPDEHIKAAHAQSISDHLSTSSGASSTSSSGQEDNQKTCIVRLKLRPSKGSKKPRLGSVTQAHDENISSEDDPTKLDGEDDSNLAYTGARKHPVEKPISANGAHIEVSRSSDQDDSDVRIGRPRRSSRRRVQTDLVDNDSEQSQTGDGQADEQGNKHDTEGQRTENEQEDGLGSEDQGYNRASRSALRRKASRASMRKSDSDEEFETSNSADLPDLSTDFSTSADDITDFVENDERPKRSGRRSGRRITKPSKAPSNARRLRSARITRCHASESEDLQAELEDIRPTGRDGRRRLRERTTRPDYAIPPPLTDQMVMAESVPRQKDPMLRNRFQTLYPSYGSLGLGNIAPSTQTFGNFGPPAGMRSDSDSSDDEMTGNRATVTASNNIGLLDANLGTSTSAGVSHGKVKGSQLADADPLQIDKEINFDSVGGLQDHVNQLKEMVSLPLLYPEIFTRFHMTPPRGVLFHGPPGTGKTLMARALAASCSNEGRKISFYMRKGADCLSKWVGEAEKQLRLLFDEAKANQPSIIFFDEIDGLAPVRSAKQDQIHASIVSTLLALMDGMDARGQVVVIGATNRPDSVDPALRRPGRFDREFYFPLPSLEARQHILNIHTKQWVPQLEEDFVLQLAQLTKGYGGADLRALCTEAALFAVQRRYPQIYESAQKLVIDPSSIKILARDFMLAIKKIVPSSGRSVSSTADALPDHLRPLLETSAIAALEVLEHLVPKLPKQSILQQNMISLPSESSFAEEQMLQTLDSLRTYRPRMLLSGSPGLGQLHIGRALLHHLEGFHVQNIDLTMLFADSASTAEASLVQAFVEARRHKPGILFMPSVELWFATASPSVISIFKSLLDGLRSTDSLLLLGIAHVEACDLSMDIREFFGFSTESSITLALPDQAQINSFFDLLSSIVLKSPEDFPDLNIRQPRTLESLAVAAPIPRPEPTKAEKRAIEIKDRKTKLILKAKLGPLMELIRVRYKRFKKATLDDKAIAHLLVDPGHEVPDHMGDRDYERTEDGMIHEISSGKKFYNMDISLMEERLWSNLYLTPRQFQNDIEQILHDAKEDNSDRERLIKAQELHTNVLLHLEDMFDSNFIEECKGMALREVQRHLKHVESASVTSPPARGPPNTTNGHSPIAELSDREHPPSHQNESGIDGMDIDAHDPANNSSVNDELDPRTSFMLENLIVHEQSVTELVAREGQQLPQTPVTSIRGENSQSLEHETVLLELQASGHKETATVNGSPIIGAIFPAEPQTDTSPEESDAPLLEHPPLVRDYVAQQDLQSQWSSVCLGLNVDQLEQVNASAISSIWSARANWDRHSVARIADATIRGMVRSMKRSIDAMP